MGFPLVEILSNLSLMEVLVLLPMGIWVGYLFISNRVPTLMFILIMSAALVGVAIPFVEGIATLARWLAVFLLLFVGLLYSKIKISAGMLLFWGYSFIGIIFLFRASNFMWQLQRGLLLFIVTVAILVAFSNKPYRIFQATLIWIAVAGTIFALINFYAILANMNNLSRLSGIAKTAPFFADTMGGLLPFLLWGIWQSKSKYVKYASVLGFLTGIVALIASGQRAGTIAGVLGLAPLGFSFIRMKKNVGWSFLLVILLLSTVAYLSFQTGADRISFLLSRYSLGAGLSNRDWIWQAALSEIAVNPFLGNGTGAAEGVFTYSFHNTYLEVWYNTGFLGLLLFLASQIYFFYQAFAPNRRIRDPEKKAIRSLAQGYMLGFFALCIFESLGAGASNMNLLLYLFLGVVISGSALREAEPLETLSPKEAASRAVLRLDPSNTGFIR